MSLGRTIRRARKRVSRFRKTMKSFADELGVSVQHVRQIENDISTPSTKLMQRMIEELDMPSDLQDEAWVSLAERRLDRDILRNVTIRPAREDKSTTEVAIRATCEWMTLYYDVEFSREDKALIRDHIIAALKE